MTQITDRNPEKMDHTELRSEWEETAERTYHQHFESDEERERLYNRRQELWQEMKSRTDAEPPTCPECGAHRRRSGWLHPRDQLHRRRGYQELSAVGARADMDTTG